ncbi:Uncharacterised protein [Chlamydia abortus]|nr:Uncharacterised protein [Chlamydia abortus]
MRKAKPSAIAVFPTPGSPISMGLFFVLRDSTCTVRRISSSLPMTGSSFPSFANKVKFLQYFSRPRRLFSALGESIRLPRLILIMSFLRSSKDIFTVFFQEANGSLLDFQKANNT